MGKNYKILWSSFLISNVGDWLRKIALPIMVYEKTGSAYHMATLYGISFIPWIVFSIFGGVLADRFKKSIIIAIGHFISLAFLAILIFELDQSNLNMIVIYLLTFLLSSTEPIVHPAFQSLLPQTVVEDKLATANSGIQLIDNTLNLIGPMISGSILILTKPSDSLMINVITYFFAGVAILFIKIPNESLKETEKSNIIQNVVFGLDYVKRNKVVLSGSILFLFTNFGIHMYQSNLVYYITDVLGYSSLQYGLILSISGVGAIVGAVIAPLLNKFVKSGIIIAGSTIIAGLFTLMLALGNNYIYIGIVMGLSNICGNINVITYFSLRQKVVPKNVLGRVISITRMISYLSIPIGAFLGGILVESGRKISFIIILAGLIRLGAGIFGYFSPLRTDTEELADEEVMF